MSFHILLNYLKQLLIKKNQKKLLKSNPMIIIVFMGIWLVMSIIFTIQDGQINQYKEDLEDFQNAISNMKKDGLYPEHLYN